jgi:acetylornithine/N-succinyldiaminopimelate aminotransferase
MRTQRPAKEIQAELLKRGILTGTSADPHIVRILAPYVITSEHVALLRKALLDIKA